MLRRLQQPEDVLGGHGVDALVGVLRLPTERAAHGVGLPGASLTVGEAGGHAAVEDGVHQGPRRVPEVGGGGGEVDWLSRQEPSRVGREADS